MDKSADLKDLDLTCASRGVWLVKVRSVIDYIYVLDVVYVWRILLNLNLNWRASRSVK